MRRAHRSCMSGPALTACPMKPIHWTDWVSSQVAHTCIFDQVHVGVRCAFANRQLAGVPEPSNDNDLSRFLPVSLSGRLSRWRARRRAVASPCRMCVCFLPVHHVHRTARIHCSIHAWLGFFAADTRTWPLAHFRHHMTCLNKCCVSPNLSVFAVFPPCPSPSPLLPPGPGGCLAGAHAGEQSPLRVACACVCSRFTTSTEQPAFTAVFTHGWVCSRHARVAHWRMSGTQDMFEQLLRISTNLVFDPVHVVASENWQSVVRLPAVVS